MVLADLWTKCGSRPALLGVAADFSGQISWSAVFQEIGHWQGGGGSKRKEQDKRPCLPAS